MALNGVSTEAVMIPKTLPEAQSALKLCAHMPDERFDLTACALACAIHENPDRDITSAFTALEELTCLAQERKPTSAEQLGQLIYGDLGFVGAGHTNYDPANADLIHILTKRVGPPVGLGVVIWRHVARLTQANVSGVDNPGHFLLRLETKEGPIFINSLTGGAVFDDAGVTRLEERAGLSAFSKSILLAVSDRVLALRLQANLAVRAQAIGDDEAWFRTAQRRAILAPNNHEIAHDFSKAAEALGQIQLALEWARHADQLNNGKPHEGNRASILHHKLN
ncbi:transglutaminase family protein [Candidatus Phycosocius spiralis]|uniref:Protein SirB1 N-terminal domain-containing protein n=1 Tax=Candidatus Phycosocius spiralis TaxID=2815099 RepID=A0ABQ4PTV9_9PROT|nr:transglutaminase family protein [Candidatus Phycosocius spiralis]GIU66419.1 hypothetical protein PsB1_0573 [Candidatus Phycosocius spiralis]